MPRQVEFSVVYNHFGSSVSHHCPMSRADAVIPFLLVRKWVLTGLGGLPSVKSGEPGQVPGLQPSALYHLPAEPQMKVEQPGACSKPWLGSSAMMPLPFIIPNGMQSGAGLLYWNSDPKVIGNAF